MTYFEHTQRDVDEAFSRGRAAGRTAALNEIAGDAFTAYQVRTADTAFYPDSETGNVLAIVYCSLGLAGEGGELANKAKKLMRDGDTPALRQAMIGELGDTLWYLARLADELGVGLEQVAADNLEKLRDRAERGVLQGSGDTR